MAVQWINPGPVGFVAGGVLIVCAVALLWLLLSSRRADAERVAEVAPTPAPCPQSWHPSFTTARLEPATQVYTLRVDEPGATVEIPRQRAVRRG